MKPNIVLALLLLGSSGAISAQQRDCCLCAASNARFGVEVPAGFGSWQCRTACSASGGSSVGFKNGSCNAAPNNPPAPMPNRCPIETTGGDCKGNNWCQCNSAKVQISKNQFAVGEVVTASVQLGDLGSGKPTVDAGGGAVDWGDGTKTPTPYGNGNYQHSYAKPGNYNVSASQGRQFKWDANDGSCSYVCRASATTSVNVKRDMTVSEITELLSADKSAQAKKDLAEQKKILDLQAIKNK
jgi:hypothetical protein